MRQQQQMKIDNSIAMRLWLYISKPFQITKILEILYMLDWMWFSALSFLPSQYITGSVFNVLRASFEAYQISIFMTGVAVLHVVGLFLNMIWLRKFNLLFNVALLLYLTVSALQNIPIAAGVGYFIILIGVSIFAFLRMDETH